MKVRLTGVLHEHCLELNPTRCGVSQLFEFSESISQKMNKQDDRLAPALFSPKY